MEEFNPVLNTHRRVYNSFIKWYDRQLNLMNKHELLDMLKFICEEIETDSLETIK